MARTLRVKLRDTERDEEVWVEEIAEEREHPWHDEIQDEDEVLGGILYQWHDGDYQCDCNRHLFFERARGNDDPPERGCGEDRFVVVDAELDGETYEPLIEVDRMVYNLNGEHCDECGEQLVVENCPKMEEGGNGVLGIVVCPSCSEEDGQ